MGYFGLAGRDSWAAQPDSRGQSVGERMSKMRNSDVEIAFPAKKKRKQKNKKSKGANPKPSI